MKSSIKQSYKTLQIIYLAMLSGLVLFQFVTIVLNDFKIPGFKAGADPLNIVSALLLLLIPIGKMLSDKNLKTIEPGDSIKTKIEKLQTSMIIRWACIEASTIFSIVIFMLLEDGKQLILFMICLAAFILANPTKDRFMSLAKLNEDERKLL